jgi:hypothetical protein
MQLPMRSRQLSCNGEITNTRRLDRARPTLTYLPVGVAARNDERLDVQSRAISGAD